jgi:disulfide bond formation protein DsbB
MTNALAAKSQTRSALFLAVAMAAVVGGALGFQYIGGYIPCKLCLEERIPYYAGVPVMLLAALAGHMSWPSWLTRSLLAIGGLLMTYSLALAVYHSGVEWAWWQGPVDCTAASTGPQTSASDLLATIDKITPPACNEAAGRFLGLSFAGWNAVASLILAAIAWRAVFAKTA